MYLFVNNLLYLLLNRIWGGNVYWFIWFNISLNKRKTNSCWIKLAPSVTILGWSSSSHRRGCYHDDERVSGDALIVQCLGQHQHAALWVQVEEAAAVWVQAAVQREHQLAVGIGVLRADLQDVLPRRRVLGDPHLKTEGGGGQAPQSLEVQGIYLFLTRCSKVEIFL